MAFPVAASPVPAGSANPNPAYSGTFIPELWSPRILQKFYDACVLAAICNKDYEGEFKKYGDKVIIRQRPTLTIRDYETNGPLVTERPAANVIEMLIDKGKYFNVSLDDVMRVQSDIDMLNLWTEDAAEQLKIKIDTEVLAALPAAIPAANQGATAGRLSGMFNLGVAGTPLKIQPYNALGAGEVRPHQAIIDLSTVLNEQNCPQTGRWCIVPPWVGGALRKSEISKADEMGDDQSIARNGRIGMLAGFTIYESNLLPKAAEAGAPGGNAWWMLAGHSNGFSFASQLSEIETMRSEASFATLMRGLQVYGYKVTIPTLIAGAYVRLA